MWRVFIRGVVLASCSFPGRRCPGTRESYPLLSHSIADFPPSHLPISTREKQKEGSCSESSYSHVSLLPLVRVSYLSNRLLTPYPQPTSTGTPPHGTERELKRNARLPKSKSDKKTYMCLMEGFVDRVMYLDLHKLQS